MGIYRKEILMQSSGKGTYEITREVAEGVRESGLTDGLASVFVRHTSCSLVLMENADPTARRDLERFMDELVPDDYPHFIHTYEGPDDMPGHIKAALLPTSLQIPIIGGRMSLGTWQGIYVVEHRDAPHTRRVVALLR